MTINWSKNVAWMFSKNRPMMLQQFLHEVILFKIAQKVSNILGYFCKQIVSQKLSKIAQSGHNGSIGLWEPPPFQKASYRWNESTDSVLFTITFPVLRLRPIFGLGTPSWSGSATGVEYIGLRLSTKVGTSSVLTRAGAETTERYLKPICMNPSSYLW